MEKIPYYTQSGLARLAGLSPSAVAKAIERGLLIPVATLDGAVVVPEAEGDRWLRSRKTTPGPTAKPTRGVGG